jgi:hypothetical protein
MSEKASLQASIDCGISFAGDSNIKCLILTWSSYNELLMFNKIKETGGAPKYRTIPIDIQHDLPFAFHVKTLGQ